LRNSYKIFIGKPEGENHSEDLDIDGRIILEWILGKWGGMMWTGFIWITIGTNGELL
jgi:hypothetical protein